MKTYSYCIYTRVDFDFVFDRFSKLIFETVFDIYNKKIQITQRYAIKLCDWLREISTETFEIVKIACSDDCNIVECLSSTKSFKIVSS